MAATVLLTVAVQRTAFEPCCSRWAGHSVDHDTRNSDCVEAPSAEQLPGARFDDCAALAGDKPARWRVQILISFANLHSIRCLNAGAWLGAAQGGAAKAKTWGGGRSAAPHPKPAAGWGRPRPIWGRGRWWIRRVSADAPGKRPAAALISTGLHLYLDSASKSIQQTCCEVGPKILK